MHRYLTYIAIAALILSACTEPDQPKKADCPTGYEPCADDSTECCPIECPPGYELVGDSCQAIVTNNAFTWTTFQLTPVTPWAINDIEMINENDVWLVGEFEHPDSSHLDTMEITPETPPEVRWSNDESFNAAHWDGEKWTLLDIFTLDYQYRLTFKPIRAGLPLV